MYLEMSFEREHGYIIKVAVTCVEQSGVFIWAHLVSMAKPWEKVFTVCSDSEATQEEITQAKMELYKKLSPK